MAETLTYHQTRYRRLRDSGEWPAYQPKAKLTLPPIPDTVVAYTAGLLDGEGCIRVQRTKEYYGARVQISQKDRHVLDWVAEYFGGIVSKAPSHSCSQWTATGERAALVLELLIPFLIVKKDQAELLLSSYRNKTLSAEVSAELSRMKKEFE
jgi:hypothetical protein